MAKFTLRRDHALGWPAVFFGFLCFRESLRIHNQVVKCEIRVSIDTVLDYPLGRAFIRIAIVAKELRLEKLVYDLFSLVVDELH